MWYNMRMRVLFVLPSYITWHYTSAYRASWGVWRNIVWFLYHFFSLPLLFRTYFSRFERLGESYGRGFDPRTFFGSLIVNTIMRLLGMALRTVVILMGIAMILITAALAVLFYILWTAWPAVLLLMVIVGLDEILALS